MKTKYNTVFSLLIYIISVGALTVSDFAVIKFLPEQDIADWAFYKSLIFICGGMCVLGFDQLLLREVEKYKSFRTQFVFQSSIICMFITIGLYIYILNIIEAIQCFFILLIYSNLMFHAGFWRGKSNLLKSQLNTNLWKFVIFFCLTIYIYIDSKKNIIAIYTISFIIIFVLLYFFNKNIKDQEIKKLDREEKLRYFFLGLYFFIHSFSLVMANYGEQFIINIYENKSVSSLIFSYMTLYGSLVLASIGFIGFYLGPKVRYHKSFGIKSYYKYMFLTSFFGFFVIIINSLAAYMAYPYLYSDLQFDSLLWVLIIILTTCRVLYILPSLCLGIFGTEKDLKKSSFYSLIAVIFYIVIFAILMELDSILLTYLIVILMISHWLIKLYISNFFVIKILNNKSV